MSGKFCRPGGLIAQSFAGFESRPQQVQMADAGIFGARAVKDVQRKEVVIENDIAWRINVAVDFLFGKPISFVSKSPNSQKRAEIESILRAVFAANGAIVPRQHACGLLTWP